MKQMVCWLTAGLLTLGGLPARAGDTVPAVPETPAAPAAPAVQETPASSAAPGFWQRSWNNVETTWRSDRYELYVPAVTWHNRAFYDRDKIDEYNEQPWGLGLGRYRYDSDGNWHALYAMFFLDSHDKVEPFAGYAWQKIWRPADDLRLGAGFTVGVTARSDYSYIPFPAILPLVSVEYRRLALQATYIPGGHNNGNVLFGWLRWQL